jgi:hypothetical protein
MAGTLNTGDQGDRVDSGDAPAKRKKMNFHGQPSDPPGRLGPPGRLPVWFRWLPATTDIWNISDWPNRIQKIVFTAACSVCRHLDKSGARQSMNDGVTG